MPAAPSHAAAATQRNRQELQPMSHTDPLSVPQPRPRVLLLDDDMAMLELLPAMLAELGEFEVFVESDARRALVTLTAAAPDLLICDLSMPEMDGIEFMHAAAGAAFGGCVILLSGMDAGVRKAAEVLAQAQGLRVLAAFQKPIGLDELEAALAPLLAGQARAAGAAALPLA
jgi:CheY-like chemotaxis protein